MPVNTSLRASWAAGRQWLVAALLVSLAGIAQLGGEPCRIALRYARAGINDGEWWRLVSGHIVHLGWSHFAMNAVALLAIWVLVGSQLSVLAWVAVTAAIIVVIDAGFWWLDPGLTWYVGLSGVLHGMLAAGLLAGARSLRGESIALAVLLIAKLTYEQFAGALPGSAATAGGPVVVNAHLFGAAGGTLAGLVAVVRGHVKVSAARAAGKSADDVPRQPGETH